MKEHQKAGKLYLKLVETLVPIYGNKIEIHLGEVSDSLFINIIKKDTNDYVVTYMDNVDTKGIKERVAKLFEPKFIQAETSCIDLIGKEVYIDKKEPAYTVKSIDKTGIWLERNGVLMVMDMNRLWIKE